jgi:RNA polymerase sigma-70 factor (ECF subfamily)
MGAASGTPRLEIHRREGCCCMARTLHLASDMVVPQSATLEQLMDSYVDGSDAAFTALYRRMLPKLSGHLSKICRDHTVVEDALQSAFTKIHRARESYSRGSPVAPWALVIARRALYDELRSRRARPDVLTDSGALPELPTEDGPTKEEARQLERALSTLPGHYRDAIELTKLHGLSGDEAAKVLSTTQSAVKLRVHRGYRMLRRTLEEAQAA